MIVIQRNGFLYLAHSFRKEGVVIHREQYLGKTIPPSIDDLKEIFLRHCFEESNAFKKLNAIKKNFVKEWKTYPESVKKELLVTLSIDFTYNTNAIEGSTITHEETEEIIKHHCAPHKSLQDVQETVNHSKMFFEMFHEKKELSLSLLLSCHKGLFGETKPDIAGRVRDYLVRVGPYVAPDWQDLDTLLKEFFRWYHRKKSIMHPVELAARAHYRFEKIHPFGDGNGRVGRLIIAYVLRRAGFPQLIIEYKKRKMYYHALQKTEHDFFNYFIKRYITAHKLLLRTLNIY